MAVNSKEHTGWTYFVDTGNQKSFSEIEMQSNKAFVYTANNFNTI